jgi:site-specific DNA-methyltransferase (adenine-specific)
MEVMPTIPDKSVDMVLADLPYGVTACKWDTPLPLKDLWVRFERIVKHNAAIVFTAKQPFTTALINANPQWFRYSLVWDKVQPKGHLTAKKVPLRVHEDLLLFYGKAPSYNPQKKYGQKEWRYVGHDDTTTVYSTKRKPGTNSSTERYPTSIIHIPAIGNPSRYKNGGHPTQKPVALFEYLIRTYTNEGDTVLDPTCGSGTTAVACRKTNRHYICIEKESEYCAIAEKRLMEML